MARLKDIYKTEIAPALTKQFGYKSPMQVPRITKITLNMGVGEATGDKKILDNAVADMQKVSGQKPVVTKARKAIAVFRPSRLRRASTLVGPSGSTATSMTVFASQAPDSMLAGTAPVSSWVSNPRFFTLNGASVPKSVR